MRLQGDANMPEANIEERRVFAIALMRSKKENAPHCLRHVSQLRAAKVVGSTGFCLVHNLNFWPYDGGHEIVFNTATVGAVFLPMNCL